jgi:inorganic pyrophosphatase/K(+)-stimulated pyrophosphate-energized sodium pump
MEIFRRIATGSVAVPGKWLGLGFVVWLALSSPAHAASSAFPPGEWSWGTSLFIFLLWALALGAALVALMFAYRFFHEMVAADEGNARMVEIAGYVREGANAYLRQQYKVVAICFVVIALVLAFLAYGLGLQSKWVPFAFMTGGFFSGLSGWFGMRTATMASSRTAAGAQRSLNQGLQVAFRSGAVMGLVVVGLGLLDIALWFAVLYWVVPWFGVELSLVDITVTMLCFGMGASTQALFARVGGGIFTKAADVGADLVGKVEHSIPEDDPRNPATIADNVGDNVGDVAGMGADLYESYCGSILATAALGVAAFGSGRLIQDAGIEVTQAAITKWQLYAIFLPMAIAACGILVSIVGIYFVRTEEDASQRTLLRALARGINLSTFLVVIGAFVMSYLLLGAAYGGVSMSVIVGLLAGWLIGKWTEYSTSDEYMPTKGLADQAVTGPATVIIGGVAEGMISTWAPVIIVGLATILAFGFANQFNFSDVEYFALGLYGVGIAAVGMLSTLGITLATDAYGPIADNAGGNAQMAGLDPQVRERTDALDSLGNTTAATGKGFAIGSAALTALALLAAYVEEIRAGFDRWGNTAVLSSEDPGSIHKINNQFVLSIDEEGHRTKWLIIPTEARDPEWQKINYRPRAQQLDESFKIVGGGRDAELVQGTGEAARELGMVDLSVATLPDFSTYYDLSVLNPKVLVGVFLGAMSVFVFSAMTMKAVGRAAKGMVEEVRRQFRERPGIMDNTERPDYATPVAISTRAAQREMLVPSIMALVIPVFTGIVLGVAGVMGLLVGALTTGFCVAIFMANAGGAWDNAKKFIESGAHGGKGTEAHKAAVVGDTVGDPFKDTSGPSLNILIKLMSMVAVVVAGFTVKFSLEALGIF